MEIIKLMKNTRSIKALLVIALFAMLPTFVEAQKFALVDMEYVLKNIPAYERANEQLNQVSKKWQAEKPSTQRPQPCIKTIRTK